MSKNGTSMYLSVSEMGSDDRLGQTPDLAETRLLAQHLTGRAAEARPATWTALARRHRVHLLLATTLTPEDRQSADGIALSRELTVAAAMNSWREDDTRQLVDALASAGVDALLLKGTGLAYTVYDQPHLRPRLDVDLLIRRASLAAAEAVFAAEGWTRPAERDAELSEPQRHYVKTGPGGLLYHLDVHWKIANPRVVADTVDFDALHARAVAAPPLGRSAWTLAPADALLVACIHRVAHHADAIDLLWLWDIHLLVARLSADERVQFVTAARRAAVCGICARGIGLAANLFATAGAADLATELDAAAASSPEPSARLLGGASAVTILQSDLATLGWPDRVTLIADHLFPPATYMRARYPRWPAPLLPLAYVDRIVRGAPKWFTPWR
jgi:hypothetical protein